MRAPIPMSDVGRAPSLHVLNLTRKEEDRATFGGFSNAGADVNATTNSGDAACHVAAREGLHDVLCRLLEFGANMMAENGRHQRGNQPVSYVLEQT